MKKCLLTALAVLATSTGLSAQIEAGPHRPGNVPAGYVVTPFGYFHPSCVQSIAEGETLLANGQVQHSDGSVTGKTTCNYPRYAPDGTPKVATAKQQVPEVSGWIESASVTAPANKSFSALFASSTVPSQPQGQDGQVLFFFPGFEDISNVESILQPVITWSAGQWTVSNWNCCLSDITTQSTPVNVTPGDVIVSSITENCRLGTLSCATWNIFSLDTHTGKSTTLAKTPSEGQVFNWAFGGVLEPYYVVNCDDYPSDRHQTYQVIVFDERFIPTDPKWSVSVNTTQTPQCGYNVNAEPFQITLDFN
jgi:hypothetical protein